MAPYSTDTERWQAVAARDPQANAAFLYAVRTTGVYCRPTCSSRLPKPENVEYFAAPEQAEQAGYRACRKCRPRESGAPKAVVRACRILEEQDEAPSLEELAEAVGLSPSHLHRVFKAATGVTPRAYAEARRAERFREDLRREPTVTEALYAAGYGSSSRCYEGAGERIGMTPGQYRNGAAGQSIRFAAAESDLGWVAVGATGRGICMVALGEDAETLRREASERFPRAVLMDGDVEFQEWVRLVVRQVETPQRGAALPLDIRGTAFQRRVWEVLREIPLGATATYAEVAERLGNPTAARAVARACAANEVAVLIPCHRVVRKSGEPGGYRWGAERKRRLLAREAE